MDDKEARYRGDVHNCVRHGKGQYKYPFGGQDMFMYAGNWKSGVKNAFQGIFVGKDMFQYVGEFKDGEMTGKGKKNWEDGRSYEGMWLNGEMHGKGRWINSKTNEIYEGQFENNRRNGLGTLQRGSESYQGTFKDHKFHGTGTLLFSHSCIINGQFVENIIQGDVTKIEWDKNATFKGKYEKGMASGHGYFTANDGSYDFQGEWARGLPIISEEASYIWGGLEAPGVEDTGKDKKKDKKKAPAKKGGAAPELALEPVASIEEGGPLGSLEIRLQNGQHSMDAGSVKTASTSATDKKGKGKAAAPVDENKAAEPSLYALPFEQVRRVRISVCPVKYEQPPEPEEGEEVDPGAGTPVPFLVYGEPIELWMKKPSLEDASNSKQRFPPRSTVVMCDPSSGSTALSWGQVSASLHANRPDLFAASKALSFLNKDNEPVELEQSYDNSSELNVSSFYLDTDTSATVTVGANSEEDPVTSRQFSSDFFGAVMDFSIDSQATLSAHFEQKKRYKSFEVSLCSLVKTSPHYPATDQSSLELVLTVPGVYIEQAEKIAMEEAKEKARRELMGADDDEGEEEAGEGEEGVEEVTKEDVAARIRKMGVWKQCHLELRSIITTTVVTRIEHQVEVEEELNIELSSSEAASVNADVDETANGVVEEGEVGASVVDSSGNVVVDDAGGPSEPQRKMVNKTVIKKEKIVESKTLSCCKWSLGDSDFLPDYWHSIALVLKDTVNEKPEASPEPQDQSSPGSSIELVIDGNARRMTPNSTVPPSVITEWLSYQPISVQEVEQELHEEASSDSEAVEDGEAVEGGAEGTVELSEITVNLCAKNFSGKLKGVVLSGRADDRLDPLVSTACYSNWQRTLLEAVEQEAVIVSEESAKEERESNAEGVEEENGGVGAGDPAVAVPRGYYATTSIDVSLLCGTGGLGLSEVMVAPIQRDKEATEEIFYAVQIVDGVSEACTLPVDPDTIVPSGSDDGTTASQQEKTIKLTPKKPVEVIEMVKVARALPTFSEIIISIVPPPP